MRYLTFSVVFALLTLGVVSVFLAWYVHARRNAPGLSWVRGEQPQYETGKHLSFAGKRHPMEKKDRLPILLITLVYALTAFFQLGDLTAPQSYVDLADGQTVTVELSQTVYLTKLRYFPGLSTGSYNLEISADGEHWSTLWQRHGDESDPNKITGYYWADAAGFSPSYALTQKYNQLFKWEEVEPENPQNVKYLRLTGRPEKSTLRLCELALYSSVGENRDGQGLLNISPAGDGITAAGADALFDEGDLVPVQSTWHNSTYFDEIYHARTAQEHIDGVYPYEVTHPPMGKLILGLGIRLFGMTPFGWRFSGTLFGVLMLPILYIFLKNMFGKTPVAACGTILFAAEFMHLTQTRIATIDTYAVFFILAMYFFMYRYLTLPRDTPFAKSLVPLFLSGLMWGLGAASKWTVFYAGVGLAVVYFMGFYQRLRDWPREEKPLRGKWIAGTLLCSVAFFVLIPFAIYCAAYIPYAQTQGVALFAHSDQNGLILLFRNVWDKLSGAARAEGYQAAVIPKDNLLNIMANNQWYMFGYHSGVTSSHPYSSWWFQWLVDARPILYYMDNVHNAAGVMTHTTRFAAFSNPVVCWTGLGAILICAAHTFRRLWSKLAFLGGLGIFVAVITAKVQQTPNGVFDPQLTEEQIAVSWVVLVVCLLLYLALSGLMAWLAHGYDERAAFLLVAYLSQLVPWMFVGRTTFEYHYFPSILFLVFAISYLFNGFMEVTEDWKTPVLGLTGLAGGLYLLFYPVLIGLQIPAWYEPLVKWIESWPF